MKKSNGKVCDREIASVKPASAGEVKRQIRRFPSTADDDTSIKRPATTMEEAGQRVAGCLSSINQPFAEYWRTAEYAVLCLVSWSLDFNVLLTAARLEN